jgi:hypothetical protein
MNRRTVLGALGGAGVAGVSGYWVFGRPGKHGATRTISLTAQDDIPDRHGMEISVDVLEDTITSSRTGRLRFTIGNTGPNRAFSPAASGRCSLFNRSHGGSDEPAGLWLHTPEDAQNIDRDGTRWVADKFQSESRAFAAAGCVPMPYESGKKRTTVYELWDDYKVDGYLEPGTYRWEQEIGIWDDPSATGDAPDTSFTWGFELGLQKRD